MNQSLLSAPSGALKIPYSPATKVVVCDYPPKFSLILPTYNEAGNIKNIIEILSQLLDQYMPGCYEIIIVDDNSPDYTWKLALELTSNYPQLHVVRRVDEKGLSTAVIRGWQIAQGEILGVIDADLQHPPEVLKKLLEEMDRGADLAVASRHIEGGGVSEWSILRRFLSRGAQILGLIILPEVISRLSDPMSGYFMVRRSAIACKTLSPVGYKILIEVAARGCISWIAEVGYVFKERQDGESKVTWKQYVEYIQHLLRLRLSISARFIQFGLVGLTGVVVDMVFLYLLSDETGLGLPLTRSKIIAAELAVINNFLWNDCWTFGDISRRQPGKRQRLKRLTKFNLICMLGLILNVLFLNVFVSILNYSKYSANLLAISLVTVCNFWFNLKLSWRVTEID
ncbi:glycosyltransferase [Cyanobacterium sp. uoEpiScrs1]|uniref:glycosyltransferase n=1 Tax=Cyanobacterium sp. uoEpiScrs1 TaxID=2976343 RepID=UPI002269A101|nr:glycosyltransferase [Cyanobacterium sp. uoEpiScrs1]